MGTTLEKIAAAKQAKDECYTAIEDMGGNVITGMPFSAYAAAIRTIPQSGGTVPATTFVAGDLRAGKIAVANQSGTAVQVQGEMPDASGFTVQTGSGYYAEIICSTAGYASGTVGQIPLADTFYSQAGSTGVDIICSNAGYVYAGATVHTLIPAAGFYIDSSAQIVCGTAGVCNQGAVGQAPIAGGFNVIPASMGADIVCNTAGYANGTVGYIANASDFYLVGDQYGASIVCNTAGYASGTVAYGSIPLAQFEANTSTAYFTAALILFAPQPAIRAPAILCLTYRLHKWNLTITQARFTAETVTQQAHICSLMQAQ